MKQYVYPAVLYFDKEIENYVVAFHDLHLYTEGDTIEEAFVSAKEFLEAYFECAIEYNEEAENATEFLKVVDIVLLVDAQIK